MLVPVLDTGRFDQTAIGLSMDSEGDEKTGAVETVVADDEVVGDWRMPVGKEKLLAGGLVYVKMDKCPICQTPFSRLTMDEWGQQPVWMEWTSDDQCRLVHLACYQREQELVVQYLDKVIVVKDETLRPLLPQDRNLLSFVASVCRRQRKTFATDLRLTLLTRRPHISLVVDGLVTADQWSWQLEGEVDEKRAVVMPGAVWRQAFGCWRMAGVLKPTQRPMQTKSGMAFVGCQNVLVLVVEVSGLDGRTLMTNPQRHERELAKHLLDEFGWMLESGEGRKWLQGCGLQTSGLKKEAPFDWVPFASWRDGRLLFGCHQHRLTLSLDGGGLLQKSSELKEMVVPVYAQGDELLRKVEFTDKL